MLAIIRSAMLTMVALAPLLVPIPVDAADGELGQVWDQIRSNTLDFDRAVNAEQLSLQMGAASFQIHSGVLVPSKEILGRSTEFVFIGEAEFVATTADLVEQSQLELFAGDSSVRTIVERAVLVIADSSVVGEILGRDSASEFEAANANSAGELYAEWVGGPVRRGFGADAAQLRSLLGQARFDSFFLAWCRSETLGDFYYARDPEAVEQIVLGQFVPIDLDERERHRMIRSVRRQQKTGRYGNFNYEDLGEWDTWMATSLIGPEGEDVRGGAGFESQHYTMELDVKPDEASVGGRSTTTVRAELGDERILRFDLFRDSTVSAVELSDGTALEWIRSENGIYVSLPTALEAGKTAEVVIEYSASCLFEIEKGIYRMMDTYSWYPRIGDVDRATYEVTIRRPKKYQLLASGKVVDSGSEKAVAWERRQLDVNSIAFSFEVGDFTVETFQAGRVEVTLAFTKTSGSVQTGSKQFVRQQVIDSLTFYETQFGAYPLDYLTVVTVPRRFSQGFLGFVTLAHSLMTEFRGVVYLADGFDQAKSYETQLMETVAHEIAHQWWGNKVGWASYRDQWLSEALADFSSMLYSAHMADRSSVYLAHLSRGWKRRLARRVLNARTVESLGPVTLGTRLSSSKSSSAYGAIVYDKGRVILNMLAQSLGPEPFAKMLGALADSVANRTIDTATFLKAIERMSGANLQMFRERYVYGTGVPEIYYTYEIKRASAGGWVVDGAARLATPSRETFRLKPSTTGGWAIAKAAKESVDLDSWALAIPFQISLAARESEGVGRKGAALATGARRTAVQQGFGGRLVLKGRETKFSIPVKERPERFWFDQRGETLAYVYSEADGPKRMLRYRAYELADGQRFDEAELLYLQALNAPVVSDLDTNPPSEKEASILEKMENALIHIGLAQMHLDMDKSHKAAADLDRADALLTGLEKNRYRIWRMELRGELAIRDGKFDQAYKDMERWIYLDFPFRYDDRPGAKARRRKFSSAGRYVLTGRGYSVFAVAAHETGRAEVAAQAAKEAVEQGADLSALPALAVAEQ